MPFFVPTSDILKLQALSGQYGLYFKLGLNLFKFELKKHSRANREKKPLLKEQNTFKHEPGASDA